MFLQSGDPVMAQFVEERWEDVSGEEDGVKKMKEENFGLVFASQVSHVITCACVDLCLSCCMTTAAISVKLQQVSTPTL